MDKMDIIPIQLLLQNTRCSFRERADTFNDLQNNYGSNLNYLQILTQEKNNNIDERVELHG